MGWEKTREARAGSASISSAKLRRWRGSEKEKEVLVAVVNIDLLDEERVVEHGV